MAKINKYWGLVAVGALTAAAAGAVASVVMKKSRDSYAAFENDFEDDYLEEASAPEEEKETSEKYAQWEEDELSEDAAVEDTDEEASEEETDAEEAAEETSEEASPEEDSKEEA